MNIQELAAAMGQSETDTKAFVECVSYWMSKGYSYEDAIAKHLRVMETIASNCVKALPQLRAITVELYDDLRAVA